MTSPSPAACDAWDAYLGATAIRDDHELDAVHEAFHAGWDAATNSPDTMTTTTTRPPGSQP